MKRIFAVASFVFATSYAAFAQYQISNSDFEEWETVTISGTSGEEPLHWNSFLDASGKFAGTVRAVQLYKDTEVCPGSKGTYSAKITCRKVMGSIMAQGNMTTGQINGGSMTASDASGNYNWTNTDNSNFNCPFTGRPDSLKVWVKFNSGNGGTGKISAYLHGNGYYQDPNTANTGKLTALMAKASANATSNQTWTLYSIPFEQVRNENPSYALVSFSTNTTPGSGTTSDYMYIDDLTLVYNSEITEATFNNNPVAFDSENHADVDALYLDKFLKLTCNGAGASISKNFNDSTFLLTIKVEGNNIEEDTTNTHTYTIQFTGSASGNDDEREATYTPETTIVPSTCHAGEFYLRNLASGYFLSNDDNTIKTPHRWFVNNDGTDPAIIDETGHYIQLWRSGTGLNFACTASTRNTNYATVQIYPINDCYHIGNNVQTSLMGWTDRYVAADTENHVFNTEAREDNQDIWQFLDARQVSRVEEFWPEVENASLSNGIDATAWINNPNNNYLGGWNDTSMPTIQDGVCEQWNTPYDMYQTIQNLPLGIYELEVQGFYRDAEFVTEEAAQHAILYANKVEVPLASIADEARETPLTESDTNNNPFELYVPQRTFGATVWFQEGLYNNTTGKFYLPSMTDLTFGIRKPEVITYDWTCVDNWKLTYYGRLNFSLDYSTYNGQSLADVKELDETYDPDLLNVVMGNGGETCDITYDETTFVLTVVISGYGRTRINEVQFADPMRGINDLDASNPSPLTSNLIYDLSGRRVTTPVKAGIYIQNGQKICK